MSDDQDKIQLIMRLRAEGVRTTAVLEAMEKVLEIEAKPGPADSSIFDVQDGRSIAKSFSNAGITWKKSGKSPGSRVNGWELMRERFEAATQFPMEEPGLFVFDGCRQFIRTIPTLKRDDNKTDDVDTNSEDHIADETRYRISHKRAIMTFGKTAP